MRCVGLISFAKVAEDSFDESGNPISGAEGWSEEVPCAIVSVSDNRIGKYEDGIFHQASYSIWIEDSFASVIDRNAKRVRLWKYEELLGVFSVQSCEEYKTVGRINITVTNV